MNRLRLSLVLIAFVVTALPSTLLADDNPSPEPAKTTMETGLLDFSLKLHGKIRHSQTNLFYSPYGLASALAMVRDGAANTTLKELDTLLGIGEDDFVKLRNQIGTGKTKFHQANLLLMDSWLEPKDNYVTHIRDKHKAFVGTFDKSKKEEATGKANTWASKHTDGKINDVIAPDMINKYSRAILANALNFEAKWRSPFEKYETEKTPFTLTDGSKTTCSLMTDRMYLRHFERPNAHVVEIPYADKEFCFLLVVPKKHNLLNKVESSLSAEDLRTYTRKKVNPRLVSLGLPRFTLESDLPSDLLIPTMVSLGVETPWDWKNADFGRIRDLMHTEKDGLQRNLYLKQVFQKSTVNVHEKGMEATSVTVVIIEAGRGINTDKPVDVHADKPFLFFVMHRATATPVFVGRITDPTGLDTSKTWEDVPAAEEMTPTIPDDSFDLSTDNAEILAEATGKSKDKIKRLNARHNSWFSPETPLEGPGHEFEHLIPDGFTGILTISYDDSWSSQIELPYINGHLHGVVRYDQFGMEDTEHARYTIRKGNLHGLYLAWQNNEFDYARIYNADQETIVGINYEVQDQYPSKPEVFSIWSSALDQRHGWNVRFGPNIIENATLYRQGQPDNVETNYFMWGGGFKQDYNVYDQSQFNRKLKHKASITSRYIYGALMTEANAQVYVAGQNNPKYWMTVYDSKTGISLRRERIEGPGISIDRIFDDKGKILSDKVTCSETVTLTRNVRQDGREDLTFKKAGVQVLKMSIDSRKMMAGMTVFSEDHPTMAFSVSGDSIKAAVGNSKSPQLSVPLGDHDKEFYKRWNSCVPKEVITLPDWFKKVKRIHVRHGIDKKLKELGL